MTKNSTLAKLNLQIMWDRLIAIVEEQAQTLIRTAFSTSAREAGDLSAGVFDSNGRMLAQAVTGTPGHVNAMAASVGFFLEKYPLKTMKPGDVFVTNDPWLGTGHLHDFTVVTPKFFKEKPVALFASTTHVVDVGGIGFGADGRQVYEEGIYLPIIPLIKEGTVNETVFDILRANVREPVQVEGDLYSLTACNETGGCRLEEMLHEFDLNSLDELGEHIIRQSRIAMENYIADLPDGTWHNTMTIDGYDEPVDLVATLSIAEKKISVDFDGTSKISNYGINVPITYTQAYASFGIRCIIGSNVPNNAGSLSAVQISAPSGCLLNAPSPCAVAARHAVGQMLPDVVFGCLYKALGEVVPAEGTSCLWNPMLLGGHGLTGDYKFGDATVFAVNLFHTGGAGARPNKDGLSATAFPSGVRNTPVEITEAIAPIIIWRKEYREDSGGPGKYRGGLGQIMEITNSEGAPFAISTMFDRVHNPARGRAGGKNGATGKVYLDSGDILRPKGQQPIPSNRRLTLEMPGGGGFGDPERRDPEKVALDLSNGFITRNAAINDYSVVLKKSGKVDLKQTQRLRDRLTKISPA